MPSCILCYSQLDADTRAEHILLHAFGGRKKSRTVLCSMCNNTLGRTIDDVFAKQTLHIRNMFQLRSGSGDEAPMLRRVEVGQDKIDIEGDGTMRRIGKPFTVTHGADGKVSVQFNVSQLKEVFRYIPDVAALLKLPEEQVREKIFQSTAHMVEQRPEVAYYTLQFGGPDAFRSMAKACLTLWATHLGNDEVTGASYTKARDFVRLDSEEFVRGRCALDSRDIYASAEVTQRYGPIFNSIYVASDANGRVVGHFTLYNLLGFQIVLAESGGSPSRQVALISNPLDPETWTDSAAEELPIPFEWLDAPEYPDDLIRARRRMEAMQHLYQQLMTPPEIARISSAVLAKHGFVNSDDVVPLEELARIIPELANRVAKHRLSLPHVETLSESELRKQWAAWSAKRGV